MRLGGVLRRMESLFRFEFSSTIVFRQLMSTMFLYLFYVRSKKPVQQKRNIWGRINIGRMSGRLKIIDESVPSASLNYPESQKSNEENVHG